MLGGIYELMQSCDHAEQCCQECPKLLPESAEPMLRIGNTLMQRGIHEQAISFFKQAVSLNNKYSDGYFSLGEMHRTIRASQEAVSYYKQALDITPDHSRIYFGMALAFSHLNRREEAKKTANTALRLNPDDPISFSPVIWKIISRGVWK